MAVTPLPSALVEMFTRQAWGGVKWGVAACPKCHTALTGLKPRGLGQLGAQTATH